MPNLNKIEEYAVTLPFNINYQGKVDDTSSQEKIWADRVLSVIGTGISERILRYNFGSRVHQEAFSNQTLAKDAIQREVSAAFVEHLPLLKLIDVIFPPSNDDSKLMVEIRYALPNDTETTVYVGSVGLLGNYPPNEVR